MNDIFFDLHPPDSQGLIAIEFEVPDGSLSNWKPVSATPSLWRCVSGALYAAPAQNENESAPEV
jgi:hypothetical protein